MSLEESVSAWLRRLASPSDREAYIVRYASPLVRRPDVPVSGDEVAARVRDPEVFAAADDAIEAEFARIGAWPTA